MSQRPAITVLTDPLPWGRDLFPEGARRLVRWVRDRVRPDRRNYNRSRYRGHFAVTRSLVEGLTKIGASFNYNPLPNEIADTVIVLAGVRTLRQAIRLKQQGRIGKLFAGPNIVVFSSDFDSLLASPEVSCAITPAEWVTDLYVEDTPSLRGRCFVWPAGVDTGYWRPDPAIRRDRILIFEKQNKGPVGPVQPYVEHLRALGWPVDIIRYGTFTHRSYLEMLQRACLMVGFVTDESQGLAWAEAWSADVPTLIWKNELQVYRGRRYQCSTAPYLQPENGLFFRDLDDFARQVAHWQANRHAFAPRVWTLQNMSDEVCASRLYARLTAC